VYIMVNIECPQCHRSLPVKIETLIDCGAVPQNRSVCNTCGTALIIESSTNIFVYKEDATTTTQKGNS